MGSVELTAAFRTYKQYACTMTMRTLVFASVSNSCSCMKSPTSIIIIIIIINGQIQMDPIQLATAEWHKNDAVKTRATRN